MPHHTLSLSPRFTLLAIAADLSLLCYYRLITFRYAQCVFYYSTLRQTVQHSQRGVHEPTTSQWYFYQEIVNSYHYGAGDVWLFHDPGGFSCLSSWGNIPHSVENTRVSRILFNWFQVIGISNASPEKKVWWTEFWKFMASPQFSSLFTEWVNRSSPNESIEITYLVVT